MMTLLIQMETWENTAYYHLFKQLARRRAGCDGNSNGVRQSLSLLGRYKECVDGWGSAEVGNAVLF
jgi:hypothetical protein